MAPFVKEIRAPSAVNNQFHRKFQGLRIGDDWFYDKIYLTNRHVFPVLDIWSFLNLIINYLIDCLIKWRWMPDMDLVVKCLIRVLGDFDGAWERDSTNVEAVLKQLVANRPTDDWDDSWIWKGEFFDDTLVNGVATLLFGGHPVYVTSKIGLISERHNAWWSSRGLKRVDCQLHVPDVVMLHLARKNEPHEGILGEWVKRSNVCCSPVHPTPTAVALSVINHNWPTVEEGEKTKKIANVAHFLCQLVFIIGQF